MPVTAPVLSFEKEPRLLKRILVISVALLGLGYAGMIGYYMYSESSLVFHPRKLSQLNTDALPALTEAVTFATADGVPLSALIMKPQPAKSPYWILYFHGNGGNVMSAWYRLFWNLGVNAFAIDYGGYGLSQGTPSERGLYGDARAAYEYLRTNVGVPEDKIVIYGHSLGSALV